MTSLRATPTMKKRLRWNFGSELKITKTLERSSAVRQSSTMNPYHISRQGGHTVLSAYERRHTASQSDLNFSFETRDLEEPEVQFNFLASTRLRRSRGGPQAPQISPKDRQKNTGSFLIRRY